MRSLHAAFTLASLSLAARVVNAFDASGSARTAVEIAVSDDGPGIPLDRLGRIFDPAFTTKAVGHGSGLGRFIAHEIIGQHGGRMGADNRPGGGGRFRTRKPADQKASP